jgi:single-strand DNA-binding protein
MQNTATTPRVNTWNAVTFTGNLGKDPDMSITPNGTSVTKFPLAVSQGKNKPAMWLNVETWKQLAEKCNDKLAKGSRIQIDGFLAQDVWEKDGKKHYALKVVAQTVRPIKSSGSSSGGGFIEEDNEDDLGELDDHPF